MNYDQHHLREWLINKSLINIAELEKQANCPKDTIRHFLKNRRNIAEQHFSTIENVLTGYGYVPL